MGLAVEYVWVVFALYWLVSARKLKRAKQRESRFAFWLRAGVLVAIFEFCFSPWGRIGWLGARFVPATRAMVATGLAIEVLGIALAIWARYCLGANWSGAVTLKEGHTLISAGPYKRIRHPIYTGLALAFAGTAIAVGEWRAVLAFAAIFIAHFIKARKEEAWLEREFGAEFEVHRAHTGMFLPKF